MDNEDPKSLLISVQAHHIIEVHNPLSDDFTWQIARPIPAGPQYDDPYIDKMGMRSSGLRKGQDHVYQKITFPAKQSYKVTGDIAKVVVPHLVDEIMQREHDKRVIADPHLRLAVENRVIVNVNDLKSQMSTRTLEEQLDMQLANINQPIAQEQKQDDEEAFPSLNGSTETSEESRVAGNSGAGKTSEPKASEPTGRTKA